MAMNIQAIELKLCRPEGLLIIDAIVRAVDGKGNDVSWESSWMADADFTEDKLSEVVVPLVKHLIGPDPAGQRMITYKKPLAQFSHTVPA